MRPLRGEVGPLRCKHRHVKSNTNTSFIITHNQHAKLTSFLCVFLCGNSVSWISTTIKVLICTTHSYLLYTFKRLHKFSNISPKIDTLILECKQKQHIPRSLQESFSVWRCFDNLVATCHILRTSRLRSWKILEKVERLI